MDSPRSFSAAGAVEGHSVLYAHNELTSLSNQYMVDCMGLSCSDTSATMNDGAILIFVRILTLSTKRFALSAFAFLEKNHDGAIYTWTSYPYSDASCVFWDPPKKCKHDGTWASNVNVTSSIHTKVGSEQSLMEAVSIGNSPVCTCTRNIPKFCLVSRSCLSRHGRIQPANLHFGNLQRFMWKYGCGS